MQTKPLDRALTKVAASLNSSSIDDESLLERYFKHYENAPSDLFVKNVESQVRMARIGTFKMPYTLNDREWDSSYICSPYNQFITYAKEELTITRFKWSRVVLSWLLDLAGIFLKWTEINKNIMFNNWLLSTNLYGDLSKDDIAQLLQYALKKYPQYAIVFRSVNKVFYGEAMAFFKELGFNFVGSRQFYYIDNADDKPFRKKNTLRDLKLFNSSKYHMEPIRDASEGELERIVDLYNQLYLEKYSYNNPQFTKEFIRATLQDGTLKYYGFKKGDQLNGVLGIFSRKRIMTSSIFGHDLKRPVEEGLYRLLSVATLLIARLEGKKLHWSSGCADFKRCRGGRPDIEYLAVYHAHLPWYRRLGWKVLEFLINSVGVPIMKKYKL